MTTTSRLNETLRAAGVGGVCQRILDKPDV